MSEPEMYVPKGLKTNDNCFIAYSYSYAFLQNFKGKKFYRERSYTPPSKSLNNPGIKQKYFPLNPV